MQFLKIPAVVGNRKTGKKLVNLDVGYSSLGQYCGHRDSSRRVEVSPASYKIIKYQHDVIVLCYDFDSHLVHMTRTRLLVTAFISLT